jgi:hypothetical protein
MKKRIIGTKRIKIKGKRNFDDSGSSQINRQEELKIQPPSLTANFWINIKDQLPEYNKPVTIFTGKEVLHNWCRLSDGDNDYYAKAHSDYDNRDLLVDYVIKNITHWCDLNNLKDFTMEDKKDHQSAKIKWSPEEYKTGLSDVNIFDSVQEVTTVYQLKYRSTYCPSSWITESINKTIKGAETYMESMKIKDCLEWEIIPYVLQD